MKPEHVLTVIAMAVLLSACGGEAGPIIETVNEQYLPSIAPITLRAARAGDDAGVQFKGGCAEDGCQAEARQ